MADVIDRLISALQVNSLAKKFANANAEVGHCQQVLTDAYAAWREETGNYDIIERRSDAWEAMMAFTDSEYRALVNAKGRKRRAEKKLLAAVGGV